jgi:RNA polymerase primary sigma factor
MVTLLRKSRYLMPSQLVECDLEELWWLGDTRNRERRPADFYLIADWLGAFPELLDQMDKDQAGVLRMRYGLDESPKTLQEIGQRLGMARERVREIESVAVAKLRRLRNSLPFE